MLAAGDECALSTQLGAQPLRWGPWWRNLLESDVRRIAIVDGQCLCRTRAVMVVTWFKQWDARRIDSERVDQRSQERSIRCAVQTQALDRSRLGDDPVRRSISEDMMARDGSASASACRMSARTALPGELRRLRATR